MQDGRGFNDFQKSLKPKLEKKGWWGTKEVFDPRTGEVKTININARRLKTIFETNTRMAYNVAREEAMDELPLSVYRRYVSVLIATTREAHAHMHGIIKHKDDPFWLKNSPLNGFGCKCKKTAYSKKQIERKGWKISEDNLGDIASKDFAYDTRRGNKFTKLTKMDLDSSLEQLPKATKNKAYEKLSQTALLATFYETLGVNKGDTFIDKVNDPTIIDDSLFLDKNTKQLKIKKQERHLLLDYFTDAIRDPDEIYLQYDKFGLKKNMFKYIEVDGKKEAIMVVFRYFKDKTQGTTIFYVKHKLEQRREMKLIYQKGKSD